MSKDKRAPRLSTAARHDQILESAARLILAEGVGRCTLETVAVAAGISKALIYRHFNSREDLLRAVLEREYDIMDAHGMNDYSPNASFEEFFSDNLPKVFQYLIERGPVIRAMFNDRAVAKLLREAAVARRASKTAFYRDKARETFGLDARTTQLGVILTTNAPVASARALRSFHIEPGDAAEFWTTFLTGGWTAISAVSGLEGERD